MRYQDQQKELIEQMVRDVQKKKNIGSSIVGIKDDYENDKELCLTSVVFLNEELQQRIQKNITEPLQKIDSSHYFYPLDALHLTIKNVRTIHDPPLFSREDILKSQYVFEKTVPKFHSFDFDLRGLVSFPTSVSLMGYSDSVLYDLVSALDERLSHAGIGDNKKYISNTVFFGNITVCRFTSPPSEVFLEEIEKLKNIEIGKLMVDAISLIVCNAVCSNKSWEVVGVWRMG